MMETPSPLRYPGGKTALTPFLAELISAQLTPRLTAYAEPYAGGAGAALSLLRRGVVEQIFINDLDPRVATFWSHAVTSTADLIAKTLSTPVSIETWHAQRAIYLDPSTEGSLDLAYAVLFLNRTNRSGILNARPIGGLNQDGNWKIDARFSVPRIVEKLVEVGRLADRISVSQLEALDFLATLDRESTFTYLDPPYIKHGPGLYMNSLKWADHVELAKYLRDGPRSWLLSYDHDPRVPGVLYRGLRCAEFAIKHTASSQQRVGDEYALFSPGLRVKSLSKLGSRGGQWVRSRSRLDEFLDLERLDSEQFASTQQLLA